MAESEIDKAGIRKNPKFWGRKKISKTV